MEALLIIIGIVVTLYLVSWFASFMTLRPHYKYYEPAYKSLKEQRFIRLQDLIIGHDAAGRSRSVYFTKTNDFCIDDKNGIYIHSSSVTYSDPYAFYWLLKFRRYYRENILPL